jgi:ferredoxin
LININHLRRKCIGCNACVEEAPNLFIIDEKDGKSNLIDSKQNKDFFNKVETEDEYESAKNAELSCPVNIIKVSKN